MAGAGKARSDIYSSFLVQKWDGEIPLVLFDSAEFFFGEEAVFAFIDSQPSDLRFRFCACRPVYMEPIEREDLTFACGSDFELPHNVQQALDALNEEIATCDALSWEQDDIAIDFDDLKERAKLRVIVPKEIAT